MEYVAGFTDGDGCFRIRKKRLDAYPCLSWKQGTHGIKALEFVRDELEKHGIPSRIALDTAATDTHQAGYRMELCGRKAQAASRLLRPHLVIKRPQSDMMCELVIEKAHRVSEDNRRDRLALMERMKEAHASSGVCDDVPLTDAYLAGFFDAEGGVSVHGQTGIRLAITQKCPKILRVIQAAHGGSMVHYPKTGVHDLQWSKREDCERMIGLLMPHSIAKRPQLELVLGVTKANFIDTSMRLKKLKCSKRPSRLGIQNRPSKNPELPVGITKHKSGYMARCPGFHRAWTSLSSSPEEKLQAAIEALEAYKTAHPEFFGPPGTRVPA